MLLLYDTITRNYRQKMKLFKLFFIILYSIFSNYTLQSVLHFKTMLTEISGI